MKRVSLILAIAITAMWLMACQPAANAPANTANTNANTAKPAAAAPTTIGSSPYAAAMSSARSISRPSLTSNATGICFARAGRMASSTG